MTTKIHTHYDNLKVARNAPIEVIRAAYRSLSQKYHPDKNPNDAESARIMALINNSYEVLSNPEKRFEHDEWIKRQERSGPAKFGEDQGPKPTRTNNEIESSPPVSGQCSYWQLPESVRERLDARVSGKMSEQTAISLNDTGMKYAGLLILPLWFAYLVYSALDYRWTEGSVPWLAGFSLLACLGIAYSAAWLWEWRNSPLKKWLIVTPLYLIKTDLDRVHYCPLWQISDIKATENYNNGSYQNTSLSMSLDKTYHNFTLRRESDYKSLIDALRLYDGRLREAVKSGNGNYLISVDDFLQLRLDKKSSRETSTKSSLNYPVFGGVAAACAVVWFVSSALNEARPYEPEPYLPTQKQYLAEPRISEPTYSRPLTAPNGQSWPSTAGYVKGYKKLHADGLSTVTIDNSQNDGDVFVKLVSIDATEEYPVRQFFVPAYGQFTIGKVRAGLYDVRYKDLDSGAISKSESFSLSEEQTYDGVRYSNITMTLYKIQNGNMQTTAIPESQF
jgi:curved DNA-binding protein CbpA